MTLNELQTNKDLKLPGSSSWSGSFSDFQTMYSGDGSDLTLVSASEGNSESDEFNIILTGGYRQGEVNGRITEIKDKELKDEIMNFLNEHLGEPLSSVFHQVF